MIIFAVVLPPLILVAGLLIATMLGVKPLMLVVCLSGIYLVIVGLWLTRSAASALGAKLEEVESAAGEAPPFPWLQIASRMALPAYAAVLCLAAGTFLHFRTLEPTAIGSTLDWSFAMSVMLGLVGMTAALVTIQAIWRKTGSAGWFARTVAQLIGAASLYVAFLSMPSNLGVDAPHSRIWAWWHTDYPFSWYGWSIDARPVWLSVMMVLILFGVASVARNWRAEFEGPWQPWLMPAFLILMLGLLCGASSITGPCLSHWIVGSFVMARLATYVIFLYEPKHAVANGVPGWLSAYLLTTLLGGVALAHHLATGQFGMLMHPALNELMMPLGMSSRFWSYYLAFWLFLSRDLLILLVLNLREQSKWSDLLGIGVLALILLAARVGRDLGFGFLMPVLVPGFILEPIDLLWPVVAVLGLLLLLWRAWPARPAFAE